MSSSNTFGLSVNETSSDDNTQTISVQEEEEDDEETGSDEWEMVMPPVKFAISFSGAGFLGIYHLGVINALLSHGTSLRGKITRFAGASAGALAACLLAVAPEKLEEAKCFLLDTGVHINKLKRGPLNRDYDVMADLESYLRRSLPADAYLKAQGCLFVSITTWASLSKRSNSMSSDFASNEELIKSLLASCYIPMYAKSDAPSINNKNGNKKAWLIDGGFTDNLPQFHDIPTISVSPFSGKMDICPRALNQASQLSITVNKLPLHLNAFNFKRGVHALFPPRKEVLLEYFDLGFTDCVDYLKRTAEYHS